MSKGAFPFYERGVALEKIRKKHEDINWGGCGVFAALLGEALHNAGYDVAITMTGYGGPPRKTIKGIRKYINDCIENGEDITVNYWNHFGVPNHHVLVKVTLSDRVIYIDCDGLQTIDHPVCVDISRDDLLTFVWNPIGWNSDFDRKQIPTLKKKVNKLIVPILKEAV